MCLDPSVALVFLAATNAAVSVVFFILIVFFFFYLCLYFFLQKSFSLLINILYLHNYDV